MFLATVAAVEDGRTVRLADGRSLVLPHVLPPGPDRHAPMTDLRPVRQAAAALADRVLGREVRVDLALPGQDRYGRLRGRLRDGNGDIAAGLTQGGIVRVFPEPDAPEDRIAELMKAEGAGRAAGAGFWGTGVFAVLPTDDPSAVAADRFQIVRGIPRRVSRIGARDHLEFGEDWRTDVTVGIARHARLDPDPSDLAGRMVEARGWVRVWNGPFLEVTQACQIAPSGDTSPGPTPPS